MKINMELKKLLHIPRSEAEKFHSKTKTKMRGHDVDIKSIPKSWTETYYKGYVRLQKAPLPAPTLSHGLGLRDALDNRSSAREFSQTALSIKQLSTLLYYSVGIKNIQSGRRFYPSAGARFPLETYILSLNTELGKRLYHYYVKSHCIEKILDDQKRSDINDYFPGQQWVSHASVVVFITSIFNRTLNKYGDRGYRSVLLEAGHVGQNIYLLTSALNLNCCALGGFVDDIVNKLLDIDGVNEAIVYAFAIGNKKSKKKKDASS